MVTMDMLEQDNYYDTTPTTTLWIPSSPSGRFSDEAASSKLELHGSCLGSMVTLVCLRQSTCVSFMDWLDTPSLFSRLNAWIVVFGVEHEEYLEAVDLTSCVGTIPTGLASYIFA